MSSEYSYDEQGQFFPFFILTITALVTLPITWSIVSPSRSPAAQAMRTRTSFEPEHADHIDALRAAQKRRQRRVKRTLFVLAGWAVIAFMMYLIVVTKRTQPKLWNPWDIMGISESATEKEIKKQYKELSRKFHPDKIKPDPAKNETTESLNSFYVEIGKAYKALTDEDVRSNYIQYGHPDGKQSFSIGVALPKFLVAGGNGKYVVILYSLVLGVLLPYMVGRWWYGSQRMSKDGVLMESANRMFMEYDDSMDAGGVIAALSTGKEFEDLFGGRRAAGEEGLAKIEARVLEAGTSPFADGTYARDRERLRDLDNGVRRKALALLWAYLGRVELGDPVLDRAKFSLAPVARALLRSFSSIALAYGNAAPMIAAFHASQYLVQATLPRSSPLLQLPHFTPAVARAVDRDAKIHVSLPQFMELPDSRRRQLVVGDGLLSSGQYAEAMAVARQLPLFRVAKAFFKVTGERLIIPSSLVTLVVKGRFIPPGIETIPEIDPADLDDIDLAEDDLDAITGRKKKVVRKGPDGKPVTVVEDPVPLPLAFAPRFAADHEPTWHVFLADSKSGRLAVPPFAFSKFGSPAFHDDGTPTFAVQTLKAQFAAPGQAGPYTFAMHLVCDSYVGFDTKIEVTLAVEEASKAAAMADDDEISEPDEESLAGQMNALKSGGVSGAAARPRRKVVQESDDESGTDEEEEDTSATNTDTEDEETAKAKAIAKAKRKEKRG